MTFEKRRYNPNDSKLKIIYVQAGINDEFAIIIDEQGIGEFIE